MSESPRTDAVAFDATYRQSTYMKTSEVVDASFARQLESELNAALLKNKQLQGDSIIAEVAIERWAELSLWYQIQQPAKLRITELLSDSVWNTLDNDERDRVRRDAVNAIEACFKANELLCSTRGQGAAVNAPATPSVNQAVFGTKLP